MRTPPATARSRRRSSQPFHERRRSFTKAAAETTRQASVRARAPDRSPWPSRSQSRHLDPAQLTALRCDAAHLREPRAKPDDRRSHHADPEIEEAHEADATTSIVTTHLATVDQAESTANVHSVIDVAQVGPTFTYSGTLSCGWQRCGGEAHHLAAADRVGITRAYCPREPRRSSKNERLSLELTAGIKLVRAIPGSAHSRCRSNNMLCHAVPPRVRPRYRDRGVESVVALRARDKHELVMAPPMPRSDRGCQSRASEWDG
jgi:hypothetical protein